MLPFTTPPFPSRPSSQLHDLVGVDRLHQIRRDHDHQLSLVALPPVRAEQRAEHRHVAEPRRLFDCVRARASLGTARTGCPGDARSEEHTSELQSLMRSSYDVFCLKKHKIRYTRSK